jgi:hypothetical protein
MMIWSGLGFLVAVITFLQLVLTEAVVERLFRDDTYYQTHGWPKLIAFLIAAAITWPLGNLLNGRSSRVLLDPQTGQEVVLRPNHTLFFIRMEYWAPILALLGVIFLFVNGS